MGPGEIFHDALTASGAETGAEGADSLASTRDLAVLPGGSVPSVAPGGEARVPFDLRLAGPGGAAFSLAASRVWRLISELLCRISEWCPEMNPMPPMSAASAYT